MTKILITYMYIKKQTSNKSLYTQLWLNYYIKLIKKCIKFIISNQTLKK